MHITIDDEEQTAHGEESKTPAPIAAKLLSMRKNFGGIGVVGGRFGSITKALRGEADLHVYYDIDTTRRSWEITACRNARISMTAHHAARFADHFSDVKHDTVVLNPPFGRSNGYDDIITRAVAMTAQGGELLLIVSETCTMQQLRNFGTTAKRNDRFVGQRQWLRTLNEAGNITQLHVDDYNTCCKLWGVGKPIMLLRWERGAAHADTQITNSYGEVFSRDLRKYTTKLPLFEAFDEHFERDCDASYTWVPERHVQPAYAATTSYAKSKLLYGGIYAHAVMPSKSADMFVKEAQL